MLKIYLISVVLCIITFILLTYEGYCEIRKYKNPNKTQSILVFIPQIFKMVILSSIPLLNICIVLTYVFKSKEMVNDIVECNIGKK